jgi:hypothetical protein
MRLEVSNVKVKKVSPWQATFYSIIHCKLNRCMYLSSFHPGSVAWWPSQMKIRSLGLIPARALDVNISIWGKNIVPEICILALRLCEAL